MKQSLTILALAGLLAIAQPAWTTASAYAVSTDASSTHLILPDAEPLSDEELNEIHGDFAVLASAMLLAGQAAYEVSKTAVIGAIAGVVTNTIANALDDDSSLMDGIGCAALGGASGAIAARWSWSAPIVLGIYEGVCR